MGLFDQSTLKGVVNLDIPQVVNRPLAGGLAGNYQTIQIMKEIAHKWKGSPLVRALALKAIEKLPSHSYLDESRAIGEFVQKNVRYVMDINGIEQLTMPDTLADQILRGVIAQGDCDDMATLIATMLLSIGHDPYFRIVRYRGKTGVFEHVYVVDYARTNATGPRMRIVLDAIIKDKPIGFEIEHESGEEIAV